MTDFDVGDTIRTTATFTNYLGSPVAPATLVARVRNPSGAVATFYYSAGSIEIVGSGVFAFEYIASYPGEHFVRVEGLGSALSASEFTFNVRRSAF
jgi:hypothetical protein